MATRKFELPGVQDLEDEQHAARDLPKEGQHLIIGGPGTGKSVLALLRSRRHHQSEEDYVFLVYNHLLNQASIHLFEAELKSQQWQSWFGEQFRVLTGADNVPRLRQNNGDYEEIDWDAVLAIISDLETLPNQKFPYLVIDEGQDMPPQFYQALANLGFENFYVVADQNQQIVQNVNSTRQDIQNALAINPSDVIELRKNHRNTLPIARLAREFYTGDPASPPPDLPPSEGSIECPALWTYMPDNFAKVVARILKTADRYPGQLIGIIAPDNNVRQEYVHALNTVEVKLDNGRPRVDTFHTNYRPKISFGEGGVLVINALACKGLEFDTVFLADIDQHRYWDSIADQKKRLFYVMVARAKKRIIMLKRGEECAVAAILPDDPDVLTPHVLEDI